MNCLISSKAIYLVMAMSFAVPALAQAQQAADDGSGPARPTIITDETTPIRGRIEKSTSADSKAGGKKKSDPTSDSTDSTPDDSSSLPATGILQGTMGGSDNQAYTVGAEIGLSARGARATLGGTFGSGSAVGQLKLDLSNVRTNAYQVDSFTAAGLVNGNFKVDTSGGVNLAGVVAMPLLFKLDDVGNSAIGFGPAAGGAYRNDGNGNQTSTFGPGGYVGGWYDSGNWVLINGNSIIANSLANGTTATGEHTLYAGYRFTPMVELGVKGEVAWDYQDTKQINLYGNGQGVITVHLDKVEDPASKTSGE